MPCKGPSLYLIESSRTSSNPGGVVWDPFCRCAMTLDAAHHSAGTGPILALTGVTKIPLQARLGLVEGTGLHD